MRNPHKLETGNLKGQELSGYLGVDRRRMPLKFALEKMGVQMRSGFNCDYDYGLTYKGELDVHLDGNTRISQFTKSTIIATVT
jgi:hypothetical protein